MEVPMNQAIDTKLLERAINDILPGLTMYVRDVNLPPEIAEKYKPGMIIMERGFTDASNRVMGMVTSHRFSILSNHMADFREFEHGTNWGLFVAQRNAHFKVIDVYEYQGKTQILLLHLPDDSRWKLFRNFKMSIEDFFIGDCRNRFEVKSVQIPVPELSKDDWLARCAFPLGMDHSGNFFDLEISLVMLPVKNAGFREFYHRFIYMECSGVFKDLFGEYWTDEDTGVIAYGYIDEQLGLSFHIAAIASFNHITVRVRKEKAGFIVRYHSLEEARYLDLSKTDIDLEQFAEFEQMVRSVYDTKNPHKEQIRSLLFLDGSRHPVYPDDIAVHLLRDGNQPEQVWVRGNYLTEHEIRGELLNEPYADFGVHKGDSIQVIPQEVDGGLICISPQPS